MLILSVKLDSQQSHSASALRYICEVVRFKTAIELMNMTANENSFHQGEMSLSRVEYAYRKIKNNITTNIYPSGFQILEPELAESLGVSRTPVREALIRLEADKLIRLVPRRGMQVSALSSKDIKGIVDVCCTLISGVLAEACAKSDKLDAVLRQILSEFDNASNSEEWTLLEEQLLLTVVAITDNDHLNKVISGMFEQIRRVKVIVYESDECRAEQLKNVNQFTHCVQQQNSEDAKTALKAELDYFVSLSDQLQQKQSVQGL